MTTKVTRRLIAGFLAVTALVVATIAPGARIRRDRTIRPTARPTTSRPTSRRTAASRGRPITARPSSTWARTPWPRSRNQPVDEMHVVYARPEDVRAYRRDGKFPDGAALVKEVTRVGSEKLTTGNPTGPRTSSSGS